MNKEYILDLRSETMELQIDENHFVFYYFSNAVEPMTTLTYYEGTLDSPEYSKELLHVINGNKRMTEEEIRDKAKYFFENKSMFFEMLNEYVEENK